MSDELKAWLTKELRERNWSHRELARQSGLSQSIVSKTLSGERPASADFCIKTARALGVSAEKVLRFASILPGLPTSEDDTLQEIVELTRNLPPARRQEALRYIRYLIQIGQDE